MNIAKVLVFGFMTFQAWLLVILYVIAGQGLENSASNEVAQQDPTSRPFYLGCIVAVCIVVYVLQILRSKWIHRPNLNEVKFQHWIILLVLSEWPGLLGFVYAIFQQKTAALNAQDSLFSAVPFMVVSIVCYLPLLPHANKVEVPKKELRT